MGHYDMAATAVDAAFTVLNVAAAVALPVGAALIVLEIVGRLSSGRKSAVAVGLAAAAVAVAAGWFDLLPLAFLACWLGWLGSLTYDRARRSARDRTPARNRGTAAERAVDRSGWPISGPIGRFGGVGVTAVFFTTQLLMLLNPFQMLEVARQSAGQGNLRRREARSRDDGRNYRTKAVYTLPFTGEWLLCNGGHTPRTSHSWGILGQRFALDFVRANAAFERHTGRGTRAEEYFRHGREILAAADGTVVRKENRVRRAFLGWGVCDFTARSFLGNHVLIEHAEGEYALYAHLIRGSVTVTRGARVRRGQALGRCGHTGHSTEPHLHFHLQDSADPFWGMGLPVRFSDLLVDGAPADETLLTAGVRVRPRTGAAPSRS